MKSIYLLAFDLFEPNRCLVPRSPLNNKSRKPSKVQTTINCCQHPLGQIMAATFVLRMWGPDSRCTLYTAYYPCISERRTKWWTWDTSIVV